MTSPESEYSFSTFPYPGLRPFNSEEADIFFGREQQVNQLLDKLGASRFLAVVGASGCGKSSLIRAGLIPYLEAGFMAGTGSGWRIAEMRPGDYPILALAKALLKPGAMGVEWGGCEDAAPFLAAELRRGPLALVELMRKKPLPPGSNLLVLVDQFEEIFRMEGRDFDESNKFVDLLIETLKDVGKQKDAGGSTNLPVYLIITMRSDFLGDCALFRGLPEVINENLYLTPRLTRAQTEAAIEGPARVCGGEVEPALTNRLLNEMSPDPDQLPVLQHALMRMWRKMLEKLPTLGGYGAEAKILTLEHYKDKDIGESLGLSLDKHAEKVYSSLEEDQKPIAETMFRCLTERAMGQRDRRRPCRLGEIAEIAGVSWETVATVAEVFRHEDCNFVMPPLKESLTPESMLDIGHESLIRQWTQLNEWVHEEAQSAATYQRLVQQALQWKGGDESDLWKGLQLERIEKWWQVRRPSIPWARRYTVPPESSNRESALAEKASQEFALAEDFIKHSQEKQAKDLALKERQKSQRRIFVAVSLALCFVIVLTVAFYDFWKKAEIEKAKAEGTAASLKKEKRLRILSEKRSQADQLLAEQPDLAELLYLELDRLKQSEYADKPYTGTLLPPNLKFTPWLKALMQGSSSIGNMAAFSPDGKRLATGDGNAIQVWDLDQPWKPIKTLEGHTDTVNYVFFAPNKGKLLTSVSDSSIRVWDAQTLEPAPEPLMPDDLKRLGLYLTGGVIFNGTGTLMASFESIPVTAKLWDISNRRLLSSWQMPIDIALVDLSPDGTLLATAGPKNITQVWSFANPKKPISTYHHPDEVSNFAFNPDGKSLATISNFNLRLWNIKGNSKKPLRELSIESTSEKPDNLIYSPDGKTLAQTNQNGTVRLWDMTTLGDDLPQTLIGKHRGKVGRCAFSQNSRLFASVGTDGTVRLWDLKQKYPYMRTIDIREFDLAKGPSVEVELRPVAAGFTDNGEMWVAVLDQGKVTVRNAASPKVTNWHSYPAADNAVKDLEPTWGIFSADGTHLAISKLDSYNRGLGRDAKTTELPPVEIQVFDLKNRLGPSKLNVNGSVYSGVFNREGTRLAVVYSKGASNFIQLWKDIKGEPPAIKELANRATALAFSQNSAILAVVDDDGVWLFDTKTLQKKSFVPRSKWASEYSYAAFNPDGTLLALWNGSYGSKVQLLDISTGAWRQLESPGWMNSLAFSPDGKLLQGLLGGSIIRWDVDADSWRNAACAVANRNLTCEEWQQYIPPELSEEPYHRTCPNPEFPTPTSCPDRKPTDAAVEAELVDGESPVD